MGFDEGCKGVYGKFIGFVRQLWGHKAPQVNNLWGLSGFDVGCKWV